MFLIFVKILYAKVGRFYRGMLVDGDITSKLVIKIETSYLLSE